MYGQNANQSYQLSNYKGNQPGHDNYLRADSQQPTQQQFGGANQSYQLSNYKGNQPGHDNYLRADSQQPTQGMT